MSDIIIPEAIFSSLCSEDVTSTGGRMVLLLELSLPILPLFDSEYIDDYNNSAACILFVYPCLCTYVKGGILGAFKEYHLKS